MVKGKKLIKNDFVALISNIYVSHYDVRGL